MYDKNVVDIYDRLRGSGLLQSKGQVTMTLLGLHVVLNDKSIVGNAIQGWLASWMHDQNIVFSTPTNAQEPPDFWVGPSKAIMEVKSFNMSAGANFDIANFEAYRDLIVSKPKHLDADYLIFGYTLEQGELRVKEIWLKKIWEITSASGTFPVKTQTKRGQIYNIRPGSWFAKNPKFPIFGTKASFLKAMRATTILAKGRQEATRWYDNLEIALGVNPDDAT